MRKASKSWMERFGKLGRKQTKANSTIGKRSLRLEALESRELLSVTPGIQTIGLCYLADGAADHFYQKDTDAGNGHNRDFQYGGAGLQPLVGDWNNSDTNGRDTIAIYDSVSSTFDLRNANSSGYADVSFSYGPTNNSFIALAGDWNGDGVVSTGLYDPATSTFMLKNANSAGAIDYQFIYGAGNSGLKPVVGNWDGSGGDTIGLYNPADGTFLLKNSLQGGAADMTISFGAANWKPIAGDWDGDGVDTIGAFSPSTSTFFLRNSNTNGYAEVECQFGPQGVQNWVPLVGNWTGRLTFSSLSSSFQDADIAAVTRLMYARDWAVTHTGMSQILSTMADGNAIESGELADCRMIISSTNPETLEMSDATRVLADNVVNTNPANTTYQWAALGNLTTGTGTEVAKLNNLVNKWFKGLDLPDAAYCVPESNPVDWQGRWYQTAAGSLYDAGGPSLSDMDQGAVGDCYLISALGGIANVNASAIQDMFIYNGDDTWTVRFYYLDGGNYVADYVTVNKQLPTNDTPGSYLFYAGNGGTYVNPGQRAYNDASNELWLPLAEKAYAQWNETGRTSRPDMIDTDNAPDAYGKWEDSHPEYKNAYWAIGSGDPQVVYKQVLGQNAAGHAVSDANMTYLTTALTDGKAVTIGTKADLPDGQDGLYKNHAYVITQYHADTNKFTLYNPWGRFNKTGTPTPMFYDVSWSALKNDCTAFAVSGSSGGTGWGSPVDAIFDSSDGLDLETTAIQSGGQTSIIDSLFGSDESLLDHDLVLGAKVGLEAFAA